jgi:hypothetical protein
LNENLLEVNLNSYTDVEAVVEAGVVVVVVGTVVWHPLLQLLLHGEHIHQIMHGMQGTHGTHGLLVLKHKKITARS